MPSSSSSTTSPSLNSLSQLDCAALAHNSHAHIVHTYSRQVDSRKISPNVITDGDDVTARCHELAIAAFPPSLTFPVRSNSETCRQVDSSHRDEADWLRVSEEGAEVTGAGHRMLSSSKSGYSLVGGLAWWRSLWGTQYSSSGPAAAMPSHASGI